MRAGELFFSWNLTRVLLFNFGTHSRERNRMHAKMTRDRKKNFIATIEKTIEELERDCQKMRDVLNKVGAHQQALQGPPVVPLSSPRDPPGKLEPQVVAAPVSASNSPGSLLCAAALIAPAVTKQPVVVDSKLDPPVVETKLDPPAESPMCKRAKVSHGFSWNG
jgi:hypothetical protein